MRALAALGLARDAGDHQIAREPDARATDGLGRHDDAGEAAFHVLHAVAVEAIVFEAWRPRIAPPAAGQGIDVGMAVEHEARAAAGAGQRGDRLEAVRLDLLQIDLVASLAEELLEEPRDGSLLGLEARDADQIAGQLDQLTRVDARQHRTSQVVHSLAARLGRRDSSPAT